MKLGSIILYKNIPEFLSWVQRVVLDTIYSHASIYIGKLEKIDSHTELEANLQVGQTKFVNNPKHQDIYELMDVPEDVVVEVIQNLILVYEEKIYGFIGWPAILIRRIFERLGFTHAKKWNILWGWGVICTELVWYFLENVSLIMAARTKSVKWGYVLYDLRRYNPNLFTPKDLKDIFVKHTDCFRYKENNEV